MNDENHQAALDGIRGFAALSVVLFHVGHWLDAPIASNSFLAVDLFFLLSGYVLTLAYGRRLDFSLTVSQFIVLRLIRLMPLVVLGTLISAAYAMASVHFKHEDLPMSALATAVLLGVFNIPYFTAPLSIGGDQVFPLNGPQFSLFLEIVVNVVWASVAFLRNKWLAAVFAVLSFALIVWTGQVGGDTPGSFIAGFPRVCASFLGGVAIFHLNRALPPWRWWPVVFWICCVVLLVTFYAPQLPLSVQMAWIATVSPLLVLSGARTTLSGPVRTLALVAGRWSYPIYILHYPVFVWMNGIYQYIFNRRDPYIEGAILFILVIIAAQLVLTVYDDPVRSRLNIWFKRNRSAGHVRVSN